MTSPDRRKAWSDAFQLWANTLVRADAQRAKNTGEEGSEIVVPTEQEVSELAKKTDELARECGQEFCTTVFAIDLLSQFARKPSYKGKARTLSAIGGAFQTAGSSVDKFSFLDNVEQRVAVEMEQDSLRAHLNPNVAPLEVVTNKSRVGN